MVRTMYSVSRQLVRSFRHQLRQQSMPSYPTTSRLSATSLGFAAGISLISSEFPKDFAGTGLHLSLQQEDKAPSVGTYSVRDVSKGVEEFVTGAYTKTRHWIKKQFEKDGDAAIASLTAANAGVYILWKGAPPNFMLRHFTNSLESMRNGRVWTAFTSNFSHIGGFHLAANMLLLNRFGPEVAEILGKERFYVFYAAAGVASSLASLAFRRLTKSKSVSVGASGAVVAILWLYACFFPERRMSLFGSEKTLTMQELVMAYMVIDAAGLLGSFGKIDFAAHLGGAIFANFWFYLIRDKLVREQNARRRDQSHGFLRNYAKSEE